MSTSNTQRNWIYGGLCTAAAFLFLILYSSGSGEFLNTTLVSFNSKDYFDGIDPNGSTLGDPSYMVWALKDDAGFFIHVPAVATLVIGYAIMTLLVLIVLDGAARRSFALSFLPACAAFLVTAFMSTSWIVFDRLIPFVTLGLMIFALATTLRRSYIVAGARRVPDAPDIVESGEITDSRYA